jgi:hypothetical protein
VSLWFVTSSSLVGGFGLHHCHMFIDMRRFIRTLSLLGYITRMLMDQWSPSCEYFDSLTTEPEVCDPRTGAPSVAYC